MWIRTLCRVLCASGSVPEYVSTSFDEKGDLWFSEDAATALNDYTYETWDAYIAKSTLLAPRKTTYDLDHEPLSIKFEDVDKEVEKFMVKTFCPDDSRETEPYFVDLHESASHYIVINLKKLRIKEGASSVVKPPDAIDLEPNEEEEKKSSRTPTMTDVAFKGFFQKSKVALESGEDCTKKETWQRTFFEYVKAFKSGVEQKKFIVKTSNAPFNKSIAAAAKRGLAIPVWVREFQATLPKRKADPGAPKQPRAPRKRNRKSALHAKAKKKLKKKWTGNDDEDDDDDEEEEEEEEEEEAGVERKLPAATAVSPTPVQ